MPPPGVGTMLPDAELREKLPSGTVQKVSVHDMWKEKLVVVFTVPGAFTGTCTKKHLPGFIELASALREQAGVDDVACISVNDAHVMRAWGDSVSQCANSGASANGSSSSSSNGGCEVLGAEHESENAVRMLADGNGEFASACGLLVDKRPKGMGWRCKRAAFIVDNLTVRHLAVDESGAFGSTSAASLLVAACVLGAPSSLSLPSPGADAPCSRVEAAKTRRVPAFCAQRHIGSRASIQRKGLEGFGGDV